MYRNLVLLCATLFYLYANGQSTRGTIPHTTFSCRGRAAGYYADMETGCQVYHMCDGLGRQFSYSCPNTTLFQQRMLICDHWYMVNCSMSEKDYGANLLIGQRDKPFVSDDEMNHRTPRPDILSVPPNSRFIDGLREAESKFSIHPGNSIVGIADSISKSDNNGLDSGKNNYRPPASWSTKKPRVKINEDNIQGAASLRPTPVVEIPTTEASRPAKSNVTPPSKELVPPVAPSTESSSEEVKIDVRMKEADPVVNFINRFDPYSTDSLKTSMTQSEIIDINKHLPDGQVSSEDERTPKRNKNFDNGSNKFDRDNDKKFSEGKRFNNVNNKASTTTESSRIPAPDRELVPPKKDYSDIPSTTVGPPIYYDWKWAVPAFDLEPPKVGNASKVNITEPRTQGKSPFRDVRRPTPIPDEDQTPEPKNTEYNISSYFIPDYVFPLDKAHPSYEDEEAKTSFQVKIRRSGTIVGENPDCPQCHPAYLEPGSCEPCVMR